MPFIPLTSKTAESLDRKTYQTINTSQSGRIAALKSAALDAVKKTYTGGNGRGNPYHVKNEHEKNSVIEAITRTRAGGYVVPANAR